MTDKWALSRTLRESVDGILIRDSRMYARMKMLRALSVLCLRCKLEYRFSKQLSSSRSSVVRLLNLGFSRLRRIFRYSLATVENEQSRVRYGSVLLCVPVSSAFTTVYIAYYMRLQLETFQSKRPFTIFFLSFTTS